MKRSLAMITSLPRQILHLLFFIIGDITWHPPGWARAAKDGIVRRPLVSTLSLLGALSFLIAGGWALDWYLHQPKPPTVNWIINLDPKPAPDDSFREQDLTVSFDQSAAKLESIGKNVTDGVKLSPEIKGKWFWMGGSQLRFWPTEDWPAGKTFRITLSPSLFSSHVRLDSLSREFQTPPFTVIVSDAMFYVNPKDPATKQITATLTFSNPVDRASLEKNLTFDVESGEPTFQNGGHVAITYDKLDRVAYVRSSDISVPVESEHAILTVPTSVITTEGRTSLDSARTADVLVPSASDLFHIVSSSAVIAANSAGEPEQTLVVITSVGVKTEALSAGIHAWVLPKPSKHYDSYSDQQVEIWQSASEITPAILAKSAPVNLTAMPSEEEYATLHSFKLKAPENAWIFVQIDHGLAGVGGFTLGDKFVSISQMPPYPREVRIMNEGSLLALSGERKLSIESRGVGQLEFRLARVTPSSINHLVSQSEGDFQNPIFTNYNFDESNITERTILHQDIAGDDTSRYDYSALDFSDFVKDNDENHGKLGLFILRILARTGHDDNGYYKTDGSILPDPAKQPAGGDNSGQQDPTDGDDMVADRRLVLITDLGILVKDNADGTHDVFVQSIKTGEPVDDAQVEVLGKNGIPVVTAESDGTGRASIPSLRDFTREKEPVAYVVRRDNDVSFLPFGRQDRELNFSRFDVSGVSGLTPNDLTAFVFTDRGIYRPGDEAKIGLIVKQRNWRGKLDGLPLRLNVVDPRGTVVQSRPLKLDASGFIESNFVTGETSATGKYEVDCYLVKSENDETLLGSETLRVAEFLPDRMKIKATLSANSPEGWVSISALKGLVSLQNLYGAPAAGHRVTGKVMLDPSQFTFDRYSDYTFIDPYLNPDVVRKSQEQDLPDQTTADAGSATFDLSLKNMEPSAYRLSFLAEGFEKEGGRSVTAGAEVLVSPRAWLVGVKPDGDFSFIHLGSRRSVQLLAVDSQLKPVSVEHLKMKLAERRYVSVLVQQPNGNYAYRSVLKEIPVSESEIAIPPAGLAWPLDTDRPGDFAARLYDDHGDLVADIRYSVAGAGSVTRSLDRDAELTVRLSKQEYIPGERIEVEITAPYTGSGLITIERDKVYAYAWFQAKTTSTVQKIILPKDFEGNGYLGVTFVRALDSREIYMSPLSYAVVPFKVDQEARHTHIAIDAPKLARPDAPLNMRITASRPTKAVVYAVDEGILQVARYTLPDPLGYFFRKQALEVGTRQTVDLILPEYSVAREVAAAGGDSGEDALAHHLNPFKRKHEAPVAYWSGIVDIGPQAKTFTYKVPDYFAGTIRVMVVADTGDGGAVGSEEATAQVRGPFVISPNVPSVLAPGDTFDLSAAIANNVEGSGPAAPVNIDLQVSDGLEVVQQPASPVTIAEGRDASVHWLLRVKEKLGNADITITAENGGKKSSLVSHLSVRPPVPYLTTLTTGYFKKDEKNVPIPRQRLYPEYRKVNALASPVPQGLVRGLGEYLEHYEYGCTEQLVSKAFPTLVTDETMQMGIPRGEVAKHIEEALGVAATRQNDDGAFGLWYASPDLHFDLPSAHVMLFMTEAKEQGYDVPSDLMTRGLAHLQQDANGTPGDFAEARNQAYEIYLLARNGTVVTNALEHNHAWFEQHAKDQWSDDIAAVYEAAAYALLKDQDQADALIGQFHLRNPKHRWPEEEIDYDDDLGRAAQYIYLLAHHFPERLKNLTQDDLTTLAYPIIDDEYNTVSSAEAILALDSYARAMKTNFDTRDVEIDQVTGAVTKKLNLTPGLYPEASFNLNADALIFKKAPGGNNVPGLFYQVTESGFDDAVITQPISEGIEVSREYWDRDGRPVTTAKLGEDLTVVVRVRSTDGQHLDNVAIEDLLPGGFEIAEDSVQTGRCMYDWGGIGYVDVREDRLLAFGSIDGTETEIKYRIKATNAGTYAIPPVQAEAMYHQKIRARGVSGTLTVTN
ncbi:MAG TPA: alpha-2-macroglobulin [Candidatus Methylacidiphilales bacterium]|nr:alpha-2-macroglobulin [Candidatus Methylacidiphilales bacterium]